MIDVEAVRAATPGCAERTHLNNAGASPPSVATTRAVVDHLHLESRLGGYAAAAEATERLRGLRTSLATLLGGHRDEIALLPSATAAWTTALWSFRWRPGDRVVTAESEYGSNVLALLSLRDRRGVDIEVVACDGDGVVDLDSLGDALSRSPRLMALTHVPSNGGVIQPAREVGAMCREAGVPFLLDAAQSLGQLPLDVDEIGWDLLVAPGRKFLRGPRGTGVLHVHRPLLTVLEPLAPDVSAARLDDDLDGFSLESDVRRFEHWERDVAAFLGLANAVDEALALGIDDISMRITETADRLRNALDEADLPVHDLGRSRCGIVTTSIEGRAATDVVDELAARDIVASSTGSWSAPFDARRRQLDDLVRLSVHCFTTEVEVDHVVATLADLRTATR